MDELQQLGRYKLVRVLGRGAMGVVYEGLDPKLNRPVAVKTILKSQLVDPELAADYSARFEREAQAVARLNHPHIVTVFDFGEENEIAFIVMEIIHGKELKSYFDAKKVFGVVESVRMVGELLDALGYAHAQGIVHRDIKPANIMLDAQLHVKLTDFGVARLSDSGAERTQVGTMVGTPSHMSPEQIQGHPVGPKSDLFAAGIILYQFLTGRRPFVGEGVWAIQKKIIQDDPEPPSSLNPALTSAFDAVIFRALAKNPDDRYETAGQFRQALLNALAGLDDGDSTRLGGRLEPMFSAHPAQQSVPPVLGASDTEIEFWRSIKDGEDLEEFKLYLEKFPLGVYADLARRKLMKIVEGADTLHRSVQPDRSKAQEDATVLASTQSEVGKERTLRGGVPQVEKTKADRNKTVVFGLIVVVSLASLAGYFIFAGKKAPTAVEQVSSLKQPDQLPTPALEPTVQSPLMSAAVQNKLAVLSKEKIEPISSKKDEVSQKLPVAKKPDQGRIAQQEKKVEKIHVQANANVLKPDVQPVSPTSPPAVATVSPELVNPMPPIASQIPAVTEPPPNVSDLLAQASQLESAGKIREAVKLYRKAALAGSGRAAKKLGDIYSNGAGNVARDYAESVHWYDLASQKGIAVPIAGKR